MAENKKSFILYCDIIHTVKKLPKEKQADLFMTILEYVNDLNPNPDDIIIEIAFEPIKHQLKRDLKRYEQKQAQRIEAGKRSAELRKEKEIQRSLTDVDGIQHASTVNVTVNDNVNGNDNVTVNGNVLHKCNERENILPPENKNFYIKTEDMESYMISDTKWFDVICMQNNWTEQQAKHQIHEFIKKLRAENVLEKHKNDCFSHFSNWINQKLYGSQSNKSGKNPITASDYDGSYAKKRPIKSAI